VASCYSITFGIIAANRKLPLVDIKTEGIGEVEENGPTFKYTKVTLKPTITLTSPTEDQIKAAEDMAHKADSYCIITNAIRDKVAITVEPNIVSA
ncbi:MAG: OsmC family protein, partial [Armatimonadota bacterium]